MTATDLGQFRVEAFIVGRRLIPRRGGARIFRGFPQICLESASFSKNSFGRFVGYQSLTSEKRKF
jgi:hypothetical protein